MCRALSKLSIHILGFSDDFIAQARSLLIGDRYVIYDYDIEQKIDEQLIVKKDEIDCLIINHSVQTTTLLNLLVAAGVLSPCLIFFADQAQKVTQEDQQSFLYHRAEQYSLPKDKENLVNLVDQAIAQFIQLDPNNPTVEVLGNSLRSEDRRRDQASFLLQQRRLADKLRERLGYFGVYYKRHPEFFYRNLDPAAQEKFQQQFKADYREIILDYFNGGSPNNQAIDEFVSQAFLADLSVSYLLEMHMALMDEFAQQLKLEGRSEEILLDYRLTLIDIVAHLCEMYRRSLPREDPPFELLLRMD